MILERYENEKKLLDFASYTGFPIREFGKDNVLVYVNNVPVVFFLSNIDFEFTKQFLEAFPKLMKKLPEVSWDNLNIKVVFNEDGKKSIEVCGIRGSVGDFINIESVVDFLTAFKMVVNILERIKPLRFIFTYDKKDGTLRIVRVAKIVYRTIKGRQTYKVPDTLKIEEIYNENGDLIEEFYIFGATNRLESYPLSALFAEYFIGDSRRLMYENSISIERLMKLRDVISLLFDNYEIEQVYLLDAYFFAEIMKKIKMKNVSLPPFLFREKAGNLLSDYEPVVFDEKFDPHNFWKIIKFKDRMVRINKRLIENKELGDLKYQYEFELEVHLPDGSIRKIKQYSFPGYLVYVNDDRIVAVEDSESDRASVRLDEKELEYLLRETPEFCSGELLKMKIFQSKDDLVKLSGSEAVPVSVGPEIIRAEEKTGNVLFTIKCRRDTMSYLDLHDAIALALEEL